MNLCSKFLLPVHVGALLVWEWFVIVWKWELVNEVYSVEWCGLCNVVYGLEKFCIGGQSMCSEYSMCVIMSRSQRPGKKVTTSSHRKRVWNGNVPPALAVPRGRTRQFGGHELGVGVPLDT
ncbi:hypothetical protein KY285_000732 [Solanum tuberosum]|nr:hypothetical protein KY285_000732 [Solanum tuberosum]